MSKKSATHKEEYVLILTEDSSINQTIRCDENEAIRVAMEVSEQEEESVAVYRKIGATDIHHSVHSTWNPECR